MGGGGIVWRVGWQSLSSTCIIGGGPGSSSGISGERAWVRFRWRGGSRVRVESVVPFCLAFLLPRVQRGSSGDLMCGDGDGLLVEGGMSVRTKCWAGVRRVGVGGSGVITSGSGIIRVASVCSRCVLIGDGLLCRRLFF